MNLAKTIRQNRLRAGLTQERLAEKLGDQPAGAASTFTGALSGSIPDTWAAIFGCWIA